MKRNTMSHPNDCYIGILPCGCAVAWVFDSKEHPKQTAKSVAEFIEKGYRIESANTDAVRGKLGPCKCTDPAKAIADNELMKTLKAAAGM